MKFASKLKFALYTDDLASSPSICPRHKPVSIGFPSSSEHGTVLRDILSVAQSILTVADITMPNIPPHSSKAREEIRIVGGEELATSGHNLKIKEL